MIQAIAEIAAEAAQEAVKIAEDCRIPTGVIEDLQNYLNEIADGASAEEKLSEADVIDADDSELGKTPLDARSTYFKSGHSFETDDRGQIYKKDGELISGAEYCSNGGKYRVGPEGKIETLEEGYQSTYKERFDQTPAEGERGSWTGKRAESCYKPNTQTEKGAKAAESLSEHGLDGIEYRDAIPNFDDCAMESVEIDMTEDRIGNFEKADAECAKKWNSEGKDGKKDWTPRDISNYRRDHNLTWHECIDKKTCQLISRDIHEYFGHTGGVYECKKAIRQDFGGVFDA